MFRRGAFLIIILLSGCGGETPRLAPLSADAVILAFGDSLTEGYGAAEDESYPAVLARLSARRVINAGVSGEVSGEGLSRLPAMLEQHRPRLLILCHGGNDMLRGRSLARMEDNLRGMAQLARERAIPVVLLGVPNRGLFLASHEAYARIAEDMNLVFIEDLIPEILGDSDLKSDAIHPNASGYRMMAETIHATLQKSGAL